MLDYNTLCCSTLICRHRCLGARVSSYEPPISKCDAIRRINYCSCCNRRLTLALQVVSNLAIVMFTNSKPLFGRSWTHAERLVLFIVAEHAVFALQYALSQYISDATPATTLQLDRAYYLVAKLIYGKKDPQERIDVIEKQLREKASKRFDVGSPANRELKVASSFYSLTGTAPPRGTEPLFGLD
jgi:hypothetical protein